MPRRIQLFSLFVLALVTLPYLAAAAMAGPQAVFGGFLLNPQDGHTYLAKMRQGWEGHWGFRLPYTAEPGEEAPINLFYIFLGHVARITRLPMVIVYHLARIAGAAALLLSLWRFLGVTGPEEQPRGWVYVLACLGLGLGWLLFPFGLILSDFWVAEAFPFLSMYVNPHFAWSLALALWLIGVRCRPGELKQKRLPAFFIALAAAALLAVLSPFGVVVCGLALGGWLAWELADAWRSDRAQPGRLFGRGANWPAPLVDRLAALVVGGLPLLAMYAWLPRSHPALAVWNAQNLTLTPAAWDVLPALSPALLLGLPGAWTILRGGPRQGRVLVAWLALALICIYIPVNLQRRFMMGLYVPAVGLAPYTVAWLEARRPKLSGRLPNWTIALALPTTLLILVVGLFGALSNDPTLYLGRGEVEAMHWIEANTPPEALVLAIPEYGLLLPELSGRRVIYGHPYETVNAEAERQAVEQFFGNQLIGGETPQAFLARRGVDYILVGQRMNLPALPPGLPVSEVYSNGDVTVYQVLR